MHCEELVVSLAIDQPIARLYQFQTHQEREKTAEEKECGDRKRVKNCDSFMICRQQPGKESLRFIEIIPSGCFHNCFGHISASPPANRHWMSRLARQFLFVFRIAWGQCQSRTALVCRAAVPVLLCTRLWRVFVLPIRRL